jgi:hypothetical protein
MASTLNHSHSIILKSSSLTGLLWVLPLGLRLRGVHKDYPSFIAGQEKPGIGPASRRKFDALVKRAVASSRRECRALPIITN